MKLHVILATEPQLPYRSERGVNPECEKASKVGRVLVLEAKAEPNLTRPSL